MDKQKDEGQTKRRKDRQMEDRHRKAHIKADKGKYKGQTDRQKKTDLKIKRKDGQTD